MDLSFFSILGSIGVVAGLTWTAPQLYRWIRGTGPNANRIVNGLWACATIAIGLFLILDSFVILGAGVLLSTAAWVHQTHMQRERHRQGLET
jgi:hypothetical protein